jgi:hypothetical protein
VDSGTLGGALWRLSIFPRSAIRALAMLLDAGSTTAGRVTSPWASVRERWLTSSRAIALLLGVGAALRLWQYLGNPALWLDEMALGHSLIAHPMGVLLRAPLDDGQIAPPGYLLVVRSAVVAFGSSEYVLRLFPLLCSLGALVLFGQLTLRILLPRGAVLACALFALSSGVILFAAEAKQYAVDVFATLLLTCLALRWLEARTRPRAMALAAVGVVAVWFSQPAVFVLAGLGIALLAATPRAKWRSLMVALALWAVAAALSVGYARSRLSPGLMAYMTFFWRDGFMPRPVRSLEDAVWPALALRDVFSLLLQYPFAGGYLLLAVVGAVSLLRRRGEVGLLLLVPLLLTLLAGILHAYPFRLRLVLFLVPTLLLLVGEGASRVAGWVRFPVLGTLLLLGIAAPPLVALVRNPPIWRLDEVRPMLARLQQRKLPGDAVFVHYPGWQALRFYGPRYGLPLESVDVGACHPDDLHEYLRDLDRYRGRPRVWVLFSFPLPWLGEVRPMLDYLDAIGTRRETIEAPPNNRPGLTNRRQPWSSVMGSVAYLYDLSDPARLGATSAADRRLAAPVRNEGSPRCIHGPVIPQLSTMAASPLPAPR